MACLLVVEADRANLARLCAPLLELGSVFGAADAAGAEELFREEPIDLVLLSLPIEGGDGLGLLERFKRWDPQVEVILLSDADSARSAVRAVKLGAFDLVPRSLPAEALRIAAHSALRTRALSREVRQLQSRVDDLAQPAVRGRSPAMARAQALIDKAALSAVTVLLTGESGVGKEVAAREIVERGQRAGRHLVTIDCGSLPETLIESELFGHEKGAFTGAATRRPGRLELGDGGTVFFDEVGNLPLQLQTRLLRVLETREIQRLGAAKPMRVDLRFIAATNTDLETAVREGRFRADLYHRLNVLPIHIPPLRERHEDLPALVEQFLAEANRKHAKSVAPPNPAAAMMLAGYAWPGNVRELKNLIERAVILAEQRIEPEHLLGITPPWAGAGRGPRGPAGPWVPLKQAKERAAREVADDLIRRALEETRGDKRKAARLLGVSLKTIYNHLGGSPD